VPVVHAYNPSYSGAEIRRIKVQSQPRQIVHETLSQKYPTQKELSFQEEWPRPFSRGKFKREMQLPAGTRREFAPLQCSVRDEALL
jgi:hypothetical protein